MTAMEQIAEGILITDTNRTIRYVSSAFERIQTEQESAQDAFCQVESKHGQSGCYLRRGQAEAEGGNRGAHRRKGLMTIIGGLREPNSRVTPTHLTLCNVQVRPLYGVDPCRPLESSCAL